MPRYFLHIQDSSDILEDPIGQDFDDLLAAKREAAAAARDLVAEALRWGKPLGLHKLMLINDAHGRTVATVSFREALPIEWGDDENRSNFGSSRDSMDAPKA